MVSVANNHAFYRGTERLQASLNTLRRTRVRGVGAGMIKEDALRPEIFVVRGDANRVSGVF